MENFRVGVVGCGGIAQVHGTVLQHLEGVELVGCADIKPERAQAFAETYGGRAYSSMEELLEGEQLDAVHLCTPHYLHTPMAKLAASRGLHVFTEKPPVMTWEQWAEFRQLEQAPTRVGVCFQNRYNPSVQLLRAVLASGKAELAIPRSINYYTAKSFADYVMDSPDLGNDRKVDEEKLKAFLQEKFC